MIGDRIKELRLREGYSQTELGRKLQLSRSAVNAWEMGISIPSTQYIVALSKLFKVSADYLLDIEQTETVDLSALTAKEKSLIIGLVNSFIKQHALSDLLRAHGVDPEAESE